MMLAAAHQLFMYLRQTWPFIPLLWRTTRKVQSTVGFRRRSRRKRTGRRFQAREKRCCSREKSDGVTRSKERLSNYQSVHAFCNTLRARVPDADSKQRGVELAFMGFLLSYHHFAAVVGESDVAPQLHIKTSPNNKETWPFIGFVFSLNPQNP